MGECEKLVNVEYLWRARKRNFLGLPWTFTVYTLKEDKLCISSGFLNKKIEEIRLYRIRDFTVHASLFQRIFGMGTVHICSADSTTPEFDVVNVKDAETVKDLMSDQVEKARIEAGVSAKEFMASGFDGEMDEF